jgi:hypothetical protein
MGWKGGSCWRLDKELFLLGKSRFDDGANGKDVVEGVIHIGRSGFKSSARS